jgi:hypothetical protein
MKIFHTIALLLINNNAFAVHPYHSHIQLRKAKESGKGSTTNTCATHQACRNLGLVGGMGQCCPTASGTNLDCCKQKVACSANGACAALKLSGNCCPTKDGVFLDCCRQPPPTTLNKACSSNAACETLGLKGNCCPNNKGVYLDCCNASCKSFPKCAALGLAGACCPTADGKNLACCH